LKCEGLANSIALVVKVSTMELSTVQDSYIYIYIFPCS
jgi:hypothetical protein